MQLLIAILMTFCVAMPAIADNQATVIGQLKTRDKLVIMMLGEDVLLFTIKDQNGRVIVSELTEDQIRKQHQDLHKIIKELIAGYLDASL